MAIRESDRMWMVECFQGWSVGNVESGEEEKMFGGGCHLNL
jgi:hypothetical protein